MAVSDNIRDVDPAFCGLFRRFLHESQFICRQIMRNNCFSQVRHCGIANPASYTGPSRKTITRQIAINLQFFWRN